MIENQNLKAPDALSFPESIQMYEIHLKNTKEVIYVGENYDLPWEHGLIKTFMTAAEDAILTVGNAMSSFYYIPKRNINYIATGDVLRCGD